MTDSGSTHFNAAGVPRPTQEPSAGSWQAEGPLTHSPTPPAQGQGSDCFCCSLVYTISGLWGSHDRMYSTRLPIKPREPFWAGPLRVVTGPSADSAARQPIPPGSYLPAQELLKPSQDGFPQNGQCCAQGHSERRCWVQGGSWGESRLTRTVLGLSLGRSKSPFTRDR